MNESFETKIPEEGTSKDFLTKIKDGLNKNKDKHLKFIELWIKIIGKLEKVNKIEELIIFKEKSLEFPNIEEYLTNSEYKKPWKALIDDVSKLDDEKLKGNFNKSDLTIFYGHNLGNDTPKEMTSLAETSRQRTL